MKIKLVFILFLLCNGLSHAQQPNSIQYSTNNGLSSSEVYDIIQDDWGYLWISSDNGLNRYDGETFVHYTVDDGLTDNTVFRFKKDLFGRIWCTTYNNTLFAICGRDPKFVPYKYNEELKATVQNRVLQEVYFDANFNLFVTLLYMDGYIKIHSNGKVQNFTQLGEYEKLVFGAYHLNQNDHLFMVHRDSIEMDLELLDSIELDVQKYRNTLLDNAVCLQGSDKIIFGINDKIIIRKDRESVNTILLSNELIDLGQFSEDLFWFSTRNGGLSVCDLEGKEQLRFLDGKSVSSVFLDHENGLWVGTLLNGLFYFEDWKTKNFDPRKSKMPISDINKDSKGCLWLGYEDGKIYKGSSNNFKLVISAKSNRPAKFCIPNDSSELYYLANEYLFNEQGNDSTYLGSCNRIKLNSINNGDSVFLGGSGGYITKNWNDEATLIHIVNYRIFDFITIGTSQYFATQKGLYEYKDGSMSILDSCEIFTFRYNVLRNCKDYLLAGSSGTGLVVRNSDQLFVINESLGLSSNFVNTICVEDDSTIWVGTNKGVSRVTCYQNAIQVKNVSTENGLIDNDVTSILTYNDTVWIGTHKGLTYILKSVLNKKRSITNYGIHFTSIEVNDEKIAERKPFALSYDQDRIQFNFQVFFFGEGKQFEYRYKLKGLENKWNTTTNSSVLYSSLAHGEYEFVVQFKGINEDWSSQSKSISFVIYPPYWKTTWFILATICFFGFLIYLFFKYKVIIYNGDVLREILRYFLKKIRRDVPHILIQEAGVEYRINTESILFIKSDRNYLEIHTVNGKHLIREKIGNFLDLVPDPIEFIRVKRSYIIRIDQVTEKGKKYVKLGNLRLDVGETYLDELEKIII